MPSLRPLLLLLLAAIVTAPATAAVKLVPAFDNLRFDRPLYFAPVPDGSGRVVVVEQAGKVFMFPNRADVKGDEVVGVIDLSVRRKGNEEGLLGLAFHPKFKENRLVYLHFSASDPVRNVLASFKMNEDARIDPATERVLLEVEQPWGNHNGGMIEFGPDGYLYLALGDGGAAGDPKGNGQNLTTLLGTILRLDVDHQDEGKQYAVPKDNPFYDQAYRDKETRPEIWAYGLRNAWRFSFDPDTGDLWAGDVGQNRWEEIDLITKGGNYGWNFREGNHTFRQGEPPAGVTLIDPIVEHDRREARSITGGYVYRGEVIPGLRGAYVYGDYETGKLWSLRYDGKEVREHTELGNVRNPSSFGVDAEGELYVTSFDGRVYKFVQ